MKTRHRFHPIILLERFIIDFYCAKVKLWIEIDGDSHAEQAQKEYDAARTDFLGSIGCKVIRFTNNDVRYNINVVAQKIMDVCMELKLNKHH